MARLRPTKSVRVLTVEEKTRVANFFTLLIEINLQTGAANKRRAPKTAKNNVGQCAFQKESPCPIKCKACHILCIKTKTSRTRRPSVSVRDLFLNSFNRIFRGNIFKFIMEYCNDRYYRFSTPSRIIYYH